MFYMQKMYYTSHGGMYSAHYFGKINISFRTTLESKLREFQFKILNRIVFTNEKLFRLAWFIRHPVLSAKQRLNP